MRLICAALAATILVFPVVTFAQTSSQSSSSSTSSSSVSIPRLITLNGTYRPPEGQAIGHAESVTFAIYADESGGTPLWQETQVVEPEASGRYTVLLGSTLPDGVPTEVFSSGEARWLGITWVRGERVQTGRSRLTFVPYAMRAADADTLGGKPASAYILAPTGADGTTTR